MSTSFQPLKIRRALRRHYPFVSVPAEYGPDGWYYVLLDAGQRQRSLLLSCAFYEEAEWKHASLAGKDAVPSYDELCWMHEAVFDDGYAYQHFVPRVSHVNIHAYALHLWGRADGKPAMPDFGAVSGGTI